MELVGKLKDEMAQAKSKDEAKEIMENAGMKLTDDELDAVAGGLTISARHGLFKSTKHKPLFTPNDPQEKANVDRWKALGCPDLSTIPDF